MELPPEELDRVAGIARIPLGEADRERFEEELESILEDFAVLDEAYGAAEADVGEATAGALRPDEARGPDEATVRRIRAAFPAVEADLLRVPRGLR